MIRLPELPDFSCELEDREEAEERSSPPLLNEKLLLTSLPLWNSRIDWDDRALPSSFLGIVELRIRDEEFSPDFSLVRDVEKSLILAEDSSALPLDRMVRVEFNSLFLSLSIIRLCDPSDSRIRFGADDFRSPDDRLLVPDEPKLRLTPLKLCRSSVRIACRVMSSFRLMLARMSGWSERSEIRPRRLIVPSPKAT